MPTERLSQPISSARNGIKANCKPWPVNRNATPNSKVDNLSTLPIKSLFHKKIDELQEPALYRFRRLSILPVVATKRNHSEEDDK